MRGTRVHRGLREAVQHLDVVQGDVGRVRASGHHLQDDVKRLGDPPHLESVLQPPATNTLKSENIFNTLTAVKIIS